LSRANHIGADLCDAAVADEQLAKAASLMDTTLPDSMVHE
jgi:hypothetical protein